MRVVPSFQHDVLRFVTGNYGPFEPQEPCEVPLWLACLLRKRKMCMVEAPAWLRTEALERTRDAETEDRDAFQALPAHYVEVAALLLECAGDDLAAACGAATVSKLRECLADVEAARVAKVREGMLAVARQACADETTFSVKMNGASAMEVTAVRGQLLAALDGFQQQSGYTTAVVVTVISVVLLTLFACSGALIATGRRNMPPSPLDPAYGGTDAYVRGKKLGEGAFGCVYLATDAPRQRATSRVAALR